MSQDSVQQLLDLIAVNSFYISVLENKLQFAVPLPIEAASPDKSHAEHSIAILHRWLAVLDFAIAPISVRDALRGELPPETAVALLRYYVGKKSHEETDRDKADCVATFLYRESDLSKRPIPATNDRYHFIMECVKEFENTMEQTLGDVQLPELTQDASRLVQEFEFLHQEVEDLRTFDQLMDSGIVQRVRDLKQSFSASFYHPLVLTNVAAYNFMFGKKFDRLFQLTTEQIRNFAAVVQEEGASIMSKLDDDVIVKNLTDIEGSNIIQQEYGKAQEHFRKISRFKKVVDKKEKGRPSRTTGSMAVPEVPPPSATSRTASSAAGKGLLESMTGGNAIEDSKIRAEFESMRTFMRKAEKSCLSVPVLHGAFAITPAEAEALRADFGAEKSFRADYAAVLGYVVAILARFTVEQQEFVAKQKSEHLWKPHLDSLNYLTLSSSIFFSTLKEMLKLTDQRGLADKKAALIATGDRMMAAVKKAQAVLAAAKSQAV